jgi:hypothetical protein
MRLFFKNEVFWLHIHCCENLKSYIDYSFKGNCSFASEKCNIYMTDVPALVFAFNIDLFTVPQSTEFF